MKLKRKKRNVSFKALVFWILFLLFIFSFFWLRPRQWPKEKKLILAYPSQNDLVVAVFDPKNKEITKIIIPGNCEVEVARNLGRWKAKSLWQLGINEKHVGYLMSDTIIKNFKIPVNAWADSSAQSYFEANIFKVLRLTFFPYKTNLSFVDKLNLALFCLQVKEFKRSEYDLKKGLMLAERRLLDGEKGYVLTGEIDSKLLVIVGDEEISQKGIRVIIYDASTKPFLAETVSKVIGVMGGKVFSIVASEQGNLDCLIRGKEKKLARLFADVFSCQVSEKKINENFDLEITLGEDFSRRF